MHLEKYIWYLFDNYEFIKSKLDVASELLLYSFIEKPASSTYDCHKYLKRLNETENKTIAYKNVHKRIMKLKSLNLIKKKETNKEEGETKHGAIYYSITKIGIFYLFKNRLTRTNKEVIRDHKENGLFTHFLYPYIAFDTVDKITLQDINIDIFTYLHKCCLTIVELLDQLHETRVNGGTSYSIAPTDTIVNPELAYEDYVGSREFINYLKKKTGLDWLDVDKTKIIEVEKNKIIKISNDEEDLLLLQIFADENKATLSDNLGEKIFEFKIQKIGIDSYLLTEFIIENIDDKIKVMLHDDTKYFKNKIYENVFELVNRILTYDYNDNQNIHFKAEIAKKHSLKNIRRDEKFLSCVTAVKQNFDYKYNYFMNNLNDIC